MNRLKQLRTLSTAGFLLLFGGAVELAAQAEPTREELSDERVMELARGYVELLQARDYERLWEHVTPRAKQRFGSLEQFRSGGERVLGQLGTETGVLSESVEPARAGMIATKLYLRVSHYTGAEGAPMQLLIGLMDDGSIAGLAVREATVGGSRD